MMVVLFQYRFLFFRRIRYAPSRRGMQVNLRHGRLSAIMAVMEKTETKIVVSPLPNTHYPSKEEMRAHTQRLIDNPSWPFNPNFQKPFSFPACGTAQWLALAIWSRFAGDTSKIPCADKITSGDWQWVWGEIYAHNSLPSPPVWIPDATNYSMKHPEGWVQTLLDADRFWPIEINAWAMEMVEKEFRETNPDGLHLDTYANFTDIPDSKDKCEHLCRRFHAYQQARYRWHEHLLEKHCERALGAHVPSIRKKKLAGYIPKKANEARASLIGWLSKQRGYAKNPLVKEFHRIVHAKKSALSLNEKKAFFTERTHPSNRRYRITRSTPSRPDEMGWLILTWPVWNFRGWRWTDIAEAVIKKFEFVDAKGKPLDFLKTSRKQLQKAMDKNSGASRSMPAEKALALIYEYLCNPTPKEKEMHEDWERTVRSRRVAKAFEQLARLAIGNLKVLDRPIARPKRTDKKPLLWDFAWQISA